MKEIPRLSLDMQFAKSQYKSDESGNLVYYADHAAIVAALQEQVQKLAAENANLQHLLSMVGETGNANFGRTKLYTPTTDAYFNSVRAEGVDMFINNTSYELPHRLKSLLINFATRLRAGEVS